MQLIQWTDLCKSAGIVNAFQAIQAADALYDRKQKSFTRPKK
jgi:hypothetical protein